MSSRIIFTDPHGCFLTFLALRQKVPQDIPIVIAGDLIDRGPRSREMVQYCIDNNIQVTKGNHEQMMIDSSTDEQSCYVWLNNGGRKVLENYNATTRSNGAFRASILFNTQEDADAFESHVEWMKTLPTFIEFTDVKNTEGRILVVSHSSINGSWKLKDKSKTEREQQLFDQQVIWNRDVIHGGIKDVPEIYNVFGHTVMNQVRLKVPFAAIDSGCVFNTSQDKNDGYGKLTALQFPEMIVYEQENIDG